ncbi:hypothetical protein C8R44DRAFT_889099 [Mycena epipterygia]|nr:hypothetical protein C8R44DRAFT_889099 [Mycena epipterygia]
MYSRRKGDNGLRESMTGVLPVKMKRGEPDDKLSIFAGHTRFVSVQMQRGGQGAGPGLARGYTPPAALAVVPRAAAAVTPPAPAHDALIDMGRPASMLNVNVKDPRDYPHSAQDYVPPGALEERMHQQQQHLYAADSSRMQGALPPPSAPYAWYVETYALEEPHQQRPHHQHHQQQQQQQLHHPQQQHPGYPQHPEHHHHQQQQQQYAQGTPGMYAYPQHAAAYQAHNAELGLAARDSRLDGRWSTFMEDSRSRITSSRTTNSTSNGSNSSSITHSSSIWDTSSSSNNNSGLLEGIDFRAR